MFKNVASQKIALFAYDSTTGAPKTGDSANITPYVSKDYGTVTVLGTATATEMDATNAKGWYSFVLTQAETNGDALLFSAKSSTANAFIVGLLIYTDPANYSTLSVDGSGRVVTISGTVTTVTNQLTAAQIATGVWQDTTAGDFTTASSIGKSLYTSGAAPGAASGIALVGSNMGTITGALTAAQIATGVWTDTTAGDFTTALSVGKSVMNGVALGTGLTINSYTGNTPQTGDTYARVGAPAGASVSADVAAVKVDTAAVKVQTDKLTFTVANKVDANTLAMNGNATAAANVANSMQAICQGTCSGGTTTTAIVSSMTSPSSLTATGQLIGRTILFNANTTTAALQSQASNITNSTTGATPTITFTALTTAPANGDTFTIV